jgi:hypothetical protein
MLKTGAQHASESSSSAHHPARVRAAKAAPNLTFDRARIILKQSI